MTKILTPQTKNLEPSNQVTNKDEKVFKFKNEEHQLIYRAFLDILENPENLEKQTKQEIEKKKQKLKEELSDQKKQKLQSNLKLLYERLERLQNGNEKKIFTFISKNHEGIFKNVKPEDIKPLSEENFCQFLLSVFKEIREQGLAREEKLNNDKIQQIITKCVADIRGTEAKDSLIKLAGWPFGIKIDPKNISSSFMNGVKEKIPFLGKDKKEEDEPPLSDEEMVTTFLRKVFLPILFSIASISIFGPTTLAIVAAVIGTIFAVKGGVEVLFSNDKKGTLYDPHSRDEKERKEWGNEISGGINEILKSGVNETGQGNQPAVTAEEQLTQKSKQSTVLEQVTLEPVLKRRKGYDKHFRRSAERIHVEFAVQHGCFKAEFFQDKTTSFFSRFQNIATRKLLLLQVGGISPSSIIDSQSVKTTPKGDPEDRVLAKNKKGEKSHIIVDTVGLVIAAEVHSASIQDRDSAQIFCPS
ncbi:uncharacterized protein TNIN_38181 [Trichonephila inaurata madagascariensis]|uniref:Transposase IS4-like domain-containing protein n=1 Tax=Trichonephila inaurata madagascariensis TaxID=2747483 RepID=A0A8X7CG71_9ARAC|nr:uncharacterized protein TNIN_38181 [Trichonephila inaurata madagascariensis]